MIIIVKKKLSSEKEAQSKSKKWQSNSLVMAVEQPTITVKRNNKNANKIKTDSASVRVVTDGLKRAGTAIAEKIRWRKYKTVCLKQSREANAEEN